MCAHFQLFPCVAVQWTTLFNIYELKMNGRTADGKWEHIENRMSLKLSQFSAYNMVGLSENDTRFPMHMGEENFNRW